MGIRDEIARITEAKTNIINALMTRGSDIATDTVIDDIAAHVTKMNTVGKDDTGIYFEAGVVSQYVLSSDENGIYITE